MKDKWELCFVQTVGEKIDYYSPTGWNRNFTIKEFLKIQCPTISVEKGCAPLDYLIRELLNNGWEPFSYDYDFGRRTICFRFKISE